LTTTGERRHRMLNDKGKESLEIMLENMKEINEELQPIDGVDSKHNRILRVMAQGLAILIRIRLEEDKVLREAKAKMDKAAEEAAARILSEMKKEELS